MGKWNKGRRRLFKINGDKYVGWSKDKKHGKGTYTSKSGDKYVGLWENDQ